MGLDERDVGDSTDDREVVDETINAYRVREYDDGTVELRSGGRVVQKQTYFEALEAYAQWEQRRIEDLPTHLRSDHEDRIHDGVIRLRSFASEGFTPEEILDEVTGHPLAVVLDDIDQEIEVDTSSSQQK